MLDTRSDTPSILAQWTASGTRESPGRLGPLVLPWVDGESGMGIGPELLCVNPASGEPLKKELKGLWKYRVRRFRIVYAVDRTRRVLRIVAVGHRRAIYEEVTELVRRP